jgi:uncharacterized NAD(P)/FAD-binding protein YdhS
MDRMTSYPARHILILGGGASGTLLAIQILRTRSSARVTLIEKGDELGKGFAYGAAHPMHLLNVRAENMSAYPDEPDHFLQWLDRNGGLAGNPAGNRFRFVPRLTFGKYLESELIALAGRSDNHDRFASVRGEAVGILRTAAGVTVSLDNHRRITGDAAVVATGYAAPALSDLPHSHVPWARIDKGTVNDLSSVLLLGSGLSMIDHVQALVAAGYRGSIVSISRRGLIPHVHRPVEAEEINADEVPFGCSLTELWRWFRARAEAAERSGSDWRAVLDGLRPHAQALWSSLSPETQRRFVRHGRAWWDVRRHRMAPEVAATIKTLFDRRRLVIIAGKIVSVTRLQDPSAGVEVRYRRRGQNSLETLRTQAIYDCTGFNLDVGQSDNAVIRSLLGQGLARPDRLALGFDVDPSCALIDRDGVPADDLFAVGPLTRGTFWETTGIPDIRTQCASLAHRLLHTHVDPAVRVTADEQRRSAF